MKSNKNNVKLSQLILNKKNYPRKGIDYDRVNQYVDCINEGDRFPDIQVIHNQNNNLTKQDTNQYEVIDGAHRLKAFQKLGFETIEVEILITDEDPLFLAAERTGNTKELSPSEACDVAKRLYINNPDRNIKDIAKAVKRSVRSVQGYLKSLIAEYEQTREIKLIKMKQLGIPFDRIAKRLGYADSSSVRKHFDIMDTQRLFNNIISDYAKGFDPPKLSEKYSLSLPLIFNVILKEKSDKERFKELNWGLRTWDLWNFNDCDYRFGDDWPGRIPGQLVAHILFFCSKDNPSNPMLILDPMAGGGVVPDICLAFNRKCWSFDGVNRVDERPEIENFVWNVPMTFPFKSKQKPDLIIFDPPYFNKKDNEYSEKLKNSISCLSRADYLNWFDEWFIKAKELSKKGTILAFLHSDWRDFQNTSFMDEDDSQLISQHHFISLMIKAGWSIKGIIDCPLSSERFQAGMISHMQEKRILGVIRRNLIIALLK